MSVCDPRPRALATRSGLFEPELPTAGLREDALRVANAAAGNASYEHFASAGELLGELLTADGALPAHELDARLVPLHERFAPVALELVLALRGL